MTIKALARSQVDTALRQEWLDQVEELGNQLKAWVAQESDWTMTPYEQNEIEE